MGIRSKFFWTLSGVLLLGFGAAGQTEGDKALSTPTFGRPSLGEVSRRLENVERKLDQISEEKVTDVLGGNNPPAFGCPGTTAFTTDISFLYWKAFNHGWTFAYEIRSPYATASNQVFTNEIPDHVHFHWSPGIRASFGYNSGYDSWNVKGIYTWIRLTGSRDFVAKEFELLNVGGSLVALGIFPSIAFPSFLTADVYRTLEANWRCNHNIADLQFGRNFYITKALALEPILGVRFASLNQAMNTHFGESLVTVYQYISNHITNDFWGIGPRIGIDGKWTFPHNFGITGLVSGALLYGKVKQTEHLYLQREGESAFTTIQAQSNQDYQIAPTVQLALGLDWGICFNKDRAYWGLRLDWEFNYWWDQSHFDVNRSFNFPVEMQGITLKSEWNY